MAACTSAYRRAAFPCFEITGLALSLFLPLRSALKSSPARRNICFRFSNRKGLPMAARTMAETIGPKPGMDRRHSYSGNCCATLCISFSLSLTVSRAAFSLFTRLRASHLAASCTRQPADSLAASQSSRRRFSDSILIFLGVISFRNASKVIPAISLGSRQC